MARKLRIEDGLTEILDSHLEWLIVRENGRTLPTLRAEIEIEKANGKTTIGFVDERGLSVFRVEGVEFDGSEVAVKVTSRIRNIAEEIRLVPRESAAELRANIEFARLEMANEIAGIYAGSFPGTKVVRISLGATNGRIAQIEIESAERIRHALLADVTATLTHESLLASALKWSELLQQRKKNPIRGISIIAEKRQARALQKLLALLKKGASGNISIFEIDRKPEPAVAKELRRMAMSDLWRERPAKLRLPENIEPTETAAKIIGMSADKIDRIVNRNGETLRFLGIPFARVREIMGREKAWFGVGNSRRPVNESAKRAFRELRDELDLHRRAEPPNKRHEWYRLGSEAWLESILRRNIKLLDPNLILSPIYNQFRSANDRVDLLAIRRDGRLVIIEIKTSPDREMVFQAADYWRKLELQRRRGILAEARLFGSQDIADLPTLVYAVGPALSIHNDFEHFARMLHPGIELWRWDLHEDWRREIKVVGRQNYSNI